MLANAASRSEGIGGLEITSAAMLDTIIAKRSIILIEGSN
jgi:hypothetical protein